MASPSTLHHQIQQYNVEILYEHNYLQGIHRDDMWG